MRRVVVALSLLAAALSSCSTSPYTNLKVIGEIPEINDKIWTFDVALPQADNVWELGIKTDEPQVNEKVLEVKMVVMLTNLGDKQLTYNQLEGSLRVNPGTEKMVYEGVLGDFDRGRHMTYISPGGGSVRYRVDFKFLGSGKLSRPIKVVVFQQKPEF